jgi:hypothetical protein
MYKELVILFNFMHVESHQDDDALVWGLSLETHLNVEADRLAIWQPIAILFPSAKCQLIVSKKPVTQKIP